MSSTAARGVLVMAVLCWSSAARAQNLAPGPPGPYAIDVRGITIGVPNDPAFYPTLPDESAVPARAFGAGIGVHVYPFGLGVSRVGFGADLIYARGSVGGTGVATVVKGFAPQVSFNFGSREGWSYLSAGYGSTSIRSEAPVATTVISSSDVVPPLTETTGGTVEQSSLGTLNFGGGARWFLSGHIAVGFDLRFHRVGSGTDTPGAMLFSVAAGLSLR